MVSVFVWGCAGVPYGARGILCVPDGKFYANVKRVTQQKKTGVALVQVVDKKAEYDFDSQGRDNYTGMANELLSFASREFDLGEDGAAAAANEPASATTQSELQAPY